MSPKIDSQTAPANAAAARRDADRDEVRRRLLAMILKQQAAGKGLGGLPSNAVER